MTPWCIGPILVPMDYVCPVLVVYASKRGSTREVAEWIAAALVDKGHDVDVRSASDVGDLDPYAGVILGGALYMGRLHDAARAFLKRHGGAIARLPVAVFAMGPQTLREDDVAKSRRQLDAALAKTPELTPALVAIFGGVVDPTKLRFPLSRMPASDARDWDEIRRFAEQADRLFVSVQQDAPA